MKIGTRGSDLALWQARLVRALLQEKVSLETDLVIIKTQGDLDQTASSTNPSISRCIPSKTCRP